MGCSLNLSPLPQSIETTSHASVSQTILLPTQAHVSPDPPSSFPGTIILGRPVIGLTLRHDRMDNFCFTIVHELAHLYLHLDGENITFFDDTEKPVDDPGYPQENEANAFARDMLFSHEVWEEVGEDR